MYRLVFWKEKHLHHFWHEITRKCSEVLTWTCQYNHISYVMMHSTSFRAWKYVIFNLHAFKLQSGEKQTCLETISFQQQAGQIFMTCLSSKSWYIRSTDLKLVYRKEVVLYSCQRCDSTILTLEPHPDLEIPPWGALCLIYF